MLKKRKRKFKKGFLRTLFLIIIILIISIVFIFSYKKINNINFNVNNIFQNIKKSFSKEKSVNNSLNNLENNTKEESAESVEDLDDTHDFVELFRNRLPSKNLDFSSSSEISQSGDMKIFLKNTNNESGYIYINTKDDPQYVWITFVSALDSDPLKSEIKEKLAKLEYIDLRFKNKVFYKFGNYIIKNISSSTQSTTTQNVNN